MTVRHSHPHPKSNLVEHGKAVARYTGDILRTSLGESFREWIELFSSVAGNCHDLLKDTEAFQKHLYGAPSTAFSRHSGGSAFIAWLICRQILDEHPALLAGSPLRNLTPHIAFNVLTAHHSRLRRVDLYAQHAEAIQHWRVTRSSASNELLAAVYGHFGGRFCMDGLDAAVEKELKDLLLLNKDFQETMADDLFTVFFLSRLCLGALCRADIFSARNQENGQPEQASYPCFEGRASFRVDLAEFADTTGLNGLRSRFQNMVCDNWHEDGRLFQLKAPTGLGKTVAVTRIAEKALLVNPNTRVFYLAPTVAILNQVYRELRKFKVGGNAILLHYLARDFDDEENLRYDPIGYAEMRRKRDARIGNLDAGLIVTTYHRALDLLAGLSKSSCLNLANLRNAVWVLDECQFLTHYQTMVASSVFSAVASATDCRFIFMSATPPDMAFLVRTFQGLKWANPPEVWPLLSNAQLEEITSSPLVNGRRRIHVMPQVRLLSDLAQRICDYRRNYPRQSLLVLVNLARDARELYELMNSNADFVITTYLRPLDVNRQLEEAARALDAGEPILMIATSIVQAGVDLDFDAGFVELNDLRDFRQGCGRVGRSFKETRGCCDVFTFELWDNCDKRQPSWFRQRFARAIKETQDQVLIQALEANKEIVETSIRKVLASPIPLSDLDIETFERDCSDSASLLCGNVFRRLARGFPPSYDNLLFNHDTRQGFSFSEITNFLLQDLDDDSESSALAVFSVDDERACSDLLAKMGDCREMWREMYQATGHSVIDLWGRIRSMKQEILADASPYLIRRFDVVREFGRSHPRAVFYEEFDFWFVINSPCYSTLTGWQFPTVQRDRLPTEAEGVVI